MEPDKTEMTPEMETEREPRGRRWLKWIWGVLPTLALVCLVMVIGLLFMRIKSEGEVLEARKKAAVKEVPAVNVVTFEVSPAPIREKISLPGTTEPWVRLTVVAEVPGKVLEKRVSEGDTVKSGQVLAVIDDRDYAHLYRSAKATYETARSTLERLKKLQKGQLSTRSQLDEATAQVENARAAMDTAALNLERCTIRAPQAGEVNDLPIEEGHYLNVGDPVARIIQMDRLKVRVGIPESDVDAVRRVEAFNVTIDALNGRELTARKRFLSKTADPAARVYNLELALENPDRAVLPDMFARVTIVKREVADGLSIPLYSVINRDGRNQVFVAEDGVARSRPVELGLQEGWRVEIKKGLKSGDRVIVVGHRGVSDDQKISVVRSVTDISEVRL